MNELRWLQRLEHFERAIRLLRDGLATRPTAELSDLEKEGIVQRFEYTFEDVLDTGRLTHPGLREHIDRHGRLLYSRDVESGIEPRPIRNAQDPG